MYTAVNYEERVAIWRRMVRLGTFRPEAFSRTGWWMLRDLQKSGYIDVTPEGWRIARGTAGMPKEVDPAHCWQHAAWCVLRWYPEGVSLDHLHMLTELSTGVTTVELRAWLKLCVLTGVVETWRVKKPRQCRYYRCLRMNDPEPPHRFELARQIIAHDLQAEAGFTGESGERVKCRLLLLQLVEELGSIVQASHIMGHDRSTLHYLRCAFEAGGVAALAKKKRSPKGPPKTPLAAEVELQLLALCLEHPTWGVQRIAGELRLRGLKVGPTSVRRIWLRHNLARSHQRLLRLEAEAQKGTITLSKEQVRLLAGLRQGSIPRRCPTPTCSADACGPSAKPPKKKVYISGEECLRENRKATTLILPPVLAGWTGRVPC